MCPNTVARVFGDLERAGVVETRRGVGTFIRARPADALSAADRHRRLSALADRYLADAADLGVSPDEAIVRTLAALRLWPRDESNSEPRAKRPTKKR